jgi:hypothetical protein
MTTPTITLYAVRNQAGEWFRSKGRDGYGKSWTPYPDKAKLYTKIGQARGRVTFFATRWPEHGVPDIVEFAATAVRVVNETERVERVATKKAEQEAAREVRRRAAEVERAEQDKRAAEERLARLRGKQ